MARIIDREKAEKIAKKLRADIREGSAHRYADIYENGKLIAQFGIRRGSNKNQGHDHIKNDLHLGMHDTKMLAACPLTRKHWLEKLREKGML